MIKRILAILVCFTLVCALLPAICFADSTTVTTLDELRTAINDPTIDTIYLTEGIQLPDGTVLDGNNKTIRVSQPYLDEGGAVRQENISSGGIFYISQNSTVSLSNMTLMGGAVAAIVSDRAMLTMENVIVTQSNRALNAAHARTIMKNCSIVRNAAAYGGGILCAGGILLMDGCSFSENRSLAQGGGAIEVNNSAKFYMNNTIVANNTSKEIGGAVNNYNSTVYIMNSTICGNITTATLDFGGGIGNNSINGVYAVNSIITDNYYVYLGSGTPVRSDIYYQSNPIYLTKCIIDAVAQHATLNSCQLGSNQMFASYRNDGILYGTNSISTAFSRSALVSKSNNGVSLYAPISDDELNVANSGTATYFDYDSTLSSVKMSYGEGGATALGDLPVATTRVTTYYEGGTRADGVVGASGYGNETSTVYLRDNDATMGSVDGASIFGNSYTVGTTVTVNAYPAENYVLDSWTVTGADDGTEYYYGRSCTFRVGSSDVFVTPTWAEERNSLYFSEQPESLSTFTQGNITGELSASGRALIDGGAPDYNWYECSADGVITGPSLSNTSTFTIPTNLPASAQSRYYLRQVTFPGAEALDSDIAEVVVNRAAVIPDTSDSILSAALILVAMVVSAGMAVLLKKKSDF